MRKCRLIETGRCYHLISRLAHRAFFLTEEERTRAVALMRRVEEFSGVVVLAYVFMANHFHIYIYVPSVEDIDDEEILRRINILYREVSLNTILAEWRRLKDEEELEFANGHPCDGYVSRFSLYKQSFMKRMWNSSEFMRTFKQHFTMSYNGRRDHKGTMWEGRYHDRNHKPDEATMWRTAGYIDANPVKAGETQWPDGYRWCSFAAACQGDEKARRGYAFMYGTSGGWETIRTKHEISIREALAEMSERPEGKESPRKGVVVSKVDPRLPEPRCCPMILDRGKVAILERIVSLLEKGPMSPAALREAVGIKSRIHFLRYYVEPLLAQGRIERTLPDKPNASNQKYKKV